MVPTPVHYSLELLTSPSRWLVSELDCTTTSTKKPKLLKPRHVLLSAQSSCVHCSCKQTKGILCKHDYYILPSPSSSVAFAGPHTRWVFLERVPKKPQNELSGLEASHMFVPACLPPQRRTAATARRRSERREGRVGDKCENKGWEREH